MQSANKNLRERKIMSALASYEIEGFKVSNDGIEYASARLSGKATCESQIDKLIKKYMVTNSD